METDHPVDNYIRTLPELEQAELNRIKAVVEKTSPEATQGISYAIPAFLLKGQPLLAVKVNKKFISIYPFSGKVIDRVAEELNDFETTAGSVHFSLQKPLPEYVIARLVEERSQEIG